MPRKHNSFERALVDAEKRLAQALNERSQAQEALNYLAKEIPNLQRTVAALESHLNPECSSPVEQAPIRGRADGSIPSLGARCPICHTDRMGSHPYQPPHYWCTDPFHGPIAAMTENDTLPEPEGTPLTSED